MVVQTGETRDIEAREEVQRYVDWKSFGQIRHKPDFVTTFIVAGRAKRSSSFIEIKESLERSHYKQILSYLWTLHSDRGSLICPLKATIGKQPTFIYKTMKEPPHVIIEPSIEISYINRDVVETLLGSQGKHLLRKIISLIEEEAKEENWPITKVEVRLVRDPEVNDWEYVLMELYFNSNFETADKYLHNFYDKIDIFTDKLNDEEQNMLQGMIYFDVKAPIPNA